MLTYVKHSIDTIEALTYPEFSIAMALTNLINYINLYPTLHGVILVDRHDNSVYSTIFVENEDIVDISDIDTQTLRPLVAEMKRSWVNLNGNPSQLYTAPIPSVNRNPTLRDLPIFFGKNHVVVLYLTTDEFLAIPVMVEDDAMTIESHEETYDTETKVV